MDWNEIQNSLSNIVFAILLIAMISYWINLAFFNKTNFLSNFGKLASTIANGLLFFILGSRWIVSGYFPLSNLYESLIFLSWAISSIAIFLQAKTTTSPYPAGASSYCFGSKHLSDPGSPHPRAYAQTAPLTDFFSRHGASKALRQFPTFAQRLLPASFARFSGSDV